ncbi:hypothetical protein ABH931_007624 [Streptacidiphilus sp. MAP12-33]|uniref:hypothetical protein n=1 Tax=Streptacidiphilus sp. MAP12-33 TaxID=3156266 RepID=UPI003511FAE5
MSVVMSMKWAGVTPEQYDAVRDLVHWEDKLPDGAVLHVAWFEDGALRVTDVWNTEADFGRFTEERLMPGVQKVGLTGEPEVTLAPLHRRMIADGVSGAAS